MAGGPGGTRALASIGMVLATMVAVLMPGLPAAAMTTGQAPTEDAAVALDAQPRAKEPKKPNLGTFPPACPDVSYPTNDCEYYSRLGRLVVSPRIAVAGGSFTASWAGPCEYVENYGRPDQKVVPCGSDWSSLLTTFAGWDHSECSNTSPTCTIQVPKKAPTRPFAGISATRNNDQCCGGQAGSHVAILGDGQSVIQGTVIEEGRPVADATVAVGSTDVRTDAAGFYWTTVTRGKSYKVSVAKAGACVVGETPCRPFTTVTAGGAKTVDFSIEPGANLSLRFDAGEQGFEADGTKFLRLRLTIRNDGKLPLTDIALSDLAINPLDKNGVGPCKDSASIELVSGPDPAPPTSLEPGTSAALAYRVHVTSACGPVRIGAYVSGKDPKGAEQTAARGIDLDVDDAAGERAVHVTANFDALQRSTAEALAARRAALEAELNAGLPKTPDGSYNAMLEDWAGVPRGTFSWMPQNANESIVLYDAYMAGMQAESKKMFVDFSWKVGNGFTAAFDLMVNGGHMSNSEGALWAMRATDSVLAVGPSIKDTTKTWLGTSWQYLTGKAPPGAYDAVTGELYRDIAAFDLSEKVTGAIDRAADDYRAKAVAFRAEYETDPEGAARSLGGASARLAVTATKSILTEVLTEKGLGLMMRGLAKSPIASSSRFLNDGLDEGLSGAFEQRRGLAALPDGAVVSLDDAAKLGGIRADRLERAQQVIAQMEADGIKDVKISFTPSNPLSVDLVEDGLHVVKEEFQSGSTITKLDLLLGADPRAGGKYAVYKPQWPAIGQERFLSRMPAQDRPAVLKWFADREKQYADAVAGTHPIARAAKEGGARFEISAGVGQPKKFATWEVEIEKYGDTWVPRNRELTIDGRSVGKPGMYTTADLDMHVYSAKSTSEINPFALRESLRKAELGVPFHGSTVNAWDLDPNKPGDWVTYYKFQLAQIDPAEAQALAQSCADAINNRFAGAAWVEKKVTAADLLSPTMTNKVLTVTKSNIVIEYGPKPRP